MLRCQGRRIVSTCSVRLCNAVEASHVETLYLMLSANPSTTILPTFPNMAKNFCCKNDGKRPTAPETVAVSAEMKLILNILAGAILISATFIFARMLKGNSEYSRLPCGVKSNVCAAAFGIGSGSPLLPGLIGWTVIRHDRGRVASAWKLESAHAKGIRWSSMQETELMMTSRARMATLSPDSGLTPTLTKPTRGEAARCGPHGRFAILE